MLANPFSKPLPGFPGPVRYHDGSWRFGFFRSNGAPASWQWQVLPDGKTKAYWQQPLAAVLQPHDLRALTDDDHRVMSVTAATLTGKLGGGLVAKAGPFEAKLVLEGGLSVSIGQGHLVRDALMAQDGIASPLLPPRMRPITALTVRGVATSSLDFEGLDATLHFRIELPWPIDDTITFERTLFHVGGKSDQATIEEEVAPSDDRFVLRLGTGSRDGDPMSKPRVLSHLPGGADFETFDQDLAACLADPTPNPPPPPPCQEPLDGGKPPSADVCLYGAGTDLRGGTPFPPNVCLDVAGYVSKLAALDPAQKACAGAYVALLCQPASRQQTFKGASVVARVWNFDESISSELHEVMSQCVQAFADPDAPDPKQQGETLAKKMVSAAVCTRVPPLLLPQLIEDTSVVNAPTQATLEAQMPKQACGS
jgi:hypothetical protein